MKNENKSLAEEEIKECEGSYAFFATVEQDRDMFKLLKNPFAITLKCTLKTKDNEVLGVGRANSVLSPKNKFIKSAVLYCWSASVIDALSKSLKLLNELPLKADAQKEAEVRIEEIDEGRDKQAYFANEDDLKYMSDKQKSFLTKLICKKCNGTKREDYLNQIKSPYFSSFAASVLIKTLLSSNNY